MPVKIALVTYDLIVFSVYITSISVKFELVTCNLIAFSVYNVSVKFSLCYLRPCCVHCLQCVCQIRTRYLLPCCVQCLQCICQIRARYLRHYSFQCLQYVCQIRTRYVRPCCVKCLQCVCQFTLVTCDLVAFSVYSVSVNLRLFLVTLLRSLSTVCLSRPREPPARDSRCINKARAVFLAAPTSTCR